MMLFGRACKRKDKLLWRSVAEGGRFSPQFSDGHRSTKPLNLTATRFLWRDASASHCSHKQGPLLTVQTPR